MKVIDPGHVYELAWLDIDGGDDIQPYEDGHKQNHLTFAKREGDKYPGNVGHHPGTTMQEVLRALIDRLKYVDDQIPHEENTWALNSMRLTIYHLERRAAQRHGRTLSLPVENIESLPTCQKCGHIGCEGACHP